MAFVKPEKIIHSFNLQEGSIFVDFGAGSGAFVLAAAPIVGVTGTVIAIDIQKDILLKLKDTYLKAGHSNGKFLWCNFEQPGSTQLKETSTDVAVVSNTLFQLEDKSGALAEAYRVLKNKGHLYIIDWSESFKGMGPSKDLIISKKEVSELAKSIGFTLLDEFVPGDHHYGLHFTK